MELRHRHNPLRLERRLLQIIEAALKGAHDVDDLREELEELRPWIGLDRFDRQAANQLLN
jgi:hypothetical protein